MDIVVKNTKDEAGHHAADIGAEVLRTAIGQKAAANIILATGASQFEMLGRLVSLPDIEWDKVTCFHLDEYAGMPMEHPASFRRYLKERFVDRLPTPPAAFHYIDAETDSAAECRRLSDLIRDVEIDVAFIGIGENGHLAFNDPPADFETDEPYIVVQLDEACRQQQSGEGWFSTLEDVPQEAISMSVRRILKSKKIVCTVPDHRKATAVKRAIEGPVTPRLPASILQEHPDVSLVLDRNSAALLSK